MTGKHPYTEQMHRLLKSIPYIQTLCLEGSLIGEEFTLIMPFQQSNIGNPVLPALHGGGIGGLMESCAIAEIKLRNPDTAGFPKPIGVNIDYLRRGKPLETYARALIFKQGSRVANVRVRAWQENYDKPIATLSGHFLIAKASQES